MPFKSFRAGRAGRAVALLAALCALAGCAGGGNGSESFAQAGGGVTVAFESVDGPPPQVFDRLVNVLNSEAQLRDLSIVSREAAAAYRVRGYLAAEVSRGRTTIAWVLDVYDRNQNRALRLSGKEPAGKAGHDAWAAADDLTLRKIAQAGLSGLSSMVNGAAPPPATEPAPSQPQEPAIASADGLAGADVRQAAALGFAAQ
ncbi:MULTISPECIES: hypothetical protein [unclassified Nitrobacter]|uniref:hypothetical protein n=1 Tax=unclassified Nitrobacter TaxID=2620411 RepID=UPI00092B00DD|nr:MULTISPECIES: hypothetical protein [unclassified Nitrobacter]MBN9146741.1 hypothetical protein [Nitrobacter sp.]OJV01237.1 MAG: hypothetical protein BGO16_07335 [Nitrobacter sp. 62-23]